MPNSPAPTRDRTLRGSCLCGAVTYTVPDAFRYALICHCRDCRQATGSAFKPFAGIERSKLTIHAAEGQLHHFADRAASHDVRCQACGSLLYSVVGPDRVHVTLGTLVDDPSIRPSAHIFTADRAPWLKITDQLPQHPGHAAGPG